LALGFSAFFLNRTNRSGIIKAAGVIGGINQTGNYKIDCRFQPRRSSGTHYTGEKIQDRIHLSNVDGLRFLNRCEKHLPKDSLLFIDPPYYQKGSSLYTNFYMPKDHEQLARRVTKSGQNWIVTYDDEPEVRALYRSKRQYCFDINYSLHEKRIGTELLIASKGLKIPAAAKSRQVNWPQSRAA